MKVLFIGPYREGSGWAKAAQEYILALNTVPDIDLAIRPIRYGGPGEAVGQPFLKLEHKFFSTQPDVVIQNCLPHSMSYDGRCKNIGLFFTETTNLKITGWYEKIATMDAIIVPNPNSHISHHSKHHIPVPTDISKFEKQYPKFPLPIQKNDFIFYYIGEFNARKNLELLIKCFHMEFQPWEPVQLIIKTTIPGKNEQETAQAVGGFCNQIKAGLKKYVDIKHYKKEILITQRVPEEYIYGLHQQSNCFVLPSHGEGWCLPAIDAAGFNNCIVHGLPESLYGFNQQNEYRCDYLQERVYQCIHTMSNLNTCLEKWTSPTELDFCRQLREAYTWYRKDKIHNDVSGLSYEKVGRQIKDAICSIL